MHLRLASCHLQLIASRSNEPAMGIPTVCVTLTCAAFILVSATAIPQSRDSACHPCPNPCECTLVDGQTCSVNCSARGLTTFPRQLPNDRRKLILDLSSNALRDLRMHHIAHLQHLKSISLSSNSWHCHCTIFWSSRWLLGRTKDGLYIQNANRTRCDEPSYLKGITLATIGNRADLCHTSLNFVSCLKVEDGQSFWQIEYFVRSSGLQDALDCNQFCFDQDFLVSSFSNSDKMCSCGRPSAPGLTCSNNVTLANEPLEGQLVRGRFYLRNSRFVLSRIQFQVQNLTVSSTNVASVSVRLTVVPSHCVWSFGRNEGRLTKYGKSCDSADYRYIWPGYYNLTAELASVNDSVHVFGNTLVRIQDPVIASILPYSAEVKSDQPFSLSISIISGTDVSVYWNITNDSGQEERGAADFLFNVPKYITGTSNFMAFIDVIVSISESTSLTSKPNGTTLFLFPGWAFSHSGTVLRWMFKGNFLVTGQNLAFQIYRPFCSNTTYNLLPPGLEAEFSVCSKSKNFTKPESNCSDGMHYCPLSMNCLPKQSPCICDESVGDLSNVCKWAEMDNLTSHESRFNSDHHMPDYSLVGNWTVELMLEIETGYELIVNGFEVQKYDVIGLQFSSKIPPINCIHDEKSPWRQHVLSMHQDSWITRHADISTSEGIWLHNLVCDVMVIYSTPQTFKLLSPVSLPSGLNTMSVHFSNLVSHQTESLILKAVPEIKQLSLLYPDRNSIWPPLTNTSGTLVLEANTVRTFVFAVNAGSNAYLLNSFDSLVTAFGPSCPPDFPVDLHCNESYLHAVKKVIFPASVNHSGSQVLFEAVNGVSFSYLAFDILSVIQIRNVCLTNNVSQVWPLYSNAVGFRVALSGGNLIFYEWTTSDEYLSVSLLPEMEHVFSRPGKHSVSVNVSNALSFQVAVLHLTLYQLSDVNISRLELPDVVATGTLVTGSAVLRMKPYSVIACMFYVNSVLIKNVTVVSSEHWIRPDHASYEHVGFFFNASYTGIHNVLVVATDLLLHSELQSNASLAMLSRSVDAEDVITGLLLNFNVSVDDRYRYRFAVSMVTGSNVTFSFVIDQNIFINTSEAVVTHTFTSAGMHQISVSAFNRISRGKENMLIYVESSIDDSTDAHDDDRGTGEDDVDLELVGCCHEIFSTHTNVSLALTANRGSLQSFSCFWWIVHQGTVVAYFQGYNVTFTVKEPGIYSIMVRANNFKKSHVLTDTFYVQEPISSLYIYTNAGHQGIIVHQELICTAMHATGSNPVYIWNITTHSGKFDIKEIKENRMTAVFLASGTYEVHVFAKNSVSNASALDIIRALFCSPPVLQLVGSAMRQELRSQRVTVEVVVQSCVIHEASHKWLIYRGSCVAKAERVALPHSITTDTPTLHLPPRTLVYGTYCLHFSSEYVKTTNRSEVFVNLSIIASPLKAIIYGGDERALTVDEKITLDGTYSYDPDVEEGDPSQITYSWTCQANHSGLQTECFPPSNKSVYDLLPNTFNENQTYVITLSVGNQKPTFLKYIAPSTTVQKIHGKSADVPQVTINCVSCRDTNLFAITHSQIIKLVGSCGTQSCETNDEYRWAVIRNDSRSLALNSDTTTTGGNKKNLVIREFVLNCNYSYTFTLYVTSFANDVVGFASIVLQPANAPRNGTCRAIIPKSGVVVALVNAVLVTCNGWTEDSSSASQLEYNIYVNETRAVNPRWYPIYRGPRTNITFYLSTFHNLTEHVQLNVEVIDVQRSLTKALTKVINVTSPPSRMEFLATLIYEELAEEINHNDPRQIVPRIIAILLQLNSESRVGNSSQAAKQIREDMRSTLLIYLNETKTIGAIQDIQQIAFAMKLVTDIPREFPKLPVHFELVLLTLEEILMFITPYLSQGLQGDEFVPSYLLDTASNFIDAMFFLDGNGGNVFDSENHLHRQVVQRATDIIDEIMIILFQTKVAEEEPVGFYTTSISSWGQRVSVDNIQPTYTGPGAIVSFPQTLASAFEKVELFQYVTTFGYNPFQWGYAESSPISTRVVTVALFDTLGNLLDTPHLPDYDEIEISVKTAKYIPHELDDVYSVTIDQYELLSLNLSAEAPSRSVRELRNFSETLLPSDNSDTSLKVSLLPLESVSTLVALSQLNGTTLGLKISAFVNASAVDVNSLENITVQIYFGEEYIPHKYKADHSLKLVLHHQVLNGSLYGQLFKFLTLNSVLDGTRNKFYLTFVNEGVTVSVDIKFIFYEISCKYFNESNGLWNERGCRPVNATSTWTTCRCSHMATFGASSIPVHAAMEPALLSGPEFSGNPIIIATVLIALTVYIVGQVLMLYWDHLNMMMLETLPLCGKDGPFRYEVVVFTGKALGSGTTSNVGIKIFGRSSRSGRIHLFRPGSFRRSAQDKFIVATCSSLGPICKLKIWHDNSGSHPGWNLARISIRDIQNDHVYHFLADCSLSLDPSVGQIEKTLSVADESVLSTFCKKFKLDLFHRLSEQHLWVSLFDCCPWKLFGHSFRMTCCSLSTFSILAICTIFYGLVEEQTEYEDLMGKSAFRLYDSVLVFISSACSLLTSSMMLEIFRHCKQKPILLNDRSRRSSKSVTIEMDDMTGRPHLGRYSSSVGDQMMNVLNPSELFELDIDNMSDASSFQTPVASKQLHRTAVMSTSNSEINKTQTDVKKNRHIEKLLPRKQADAHLWSCDMILHSWPDAISSQRDVNDSISLSGSLSTSAEDVCSRDLKLTVGDKVQTSSHDVTLLSGVDASEKKCTSKSRDCIRTNPNQGPHYDSGVVLSDNVDSSSTDNISVFTIPFHRAGDQPTYIDIANVRQCCRSTCKNTVRESLSLPHWVSNATWLTCIILLCGSSVLTLVIGHQFNMDLSLRWLTVSLLAIVFSVVVFDTLKVLIISLVVAIKVKTINLDDYQIHENLHIGSDEQFRDVKIKPLGGFALQKAKKNAEKFHTIQMLFKRLVIYSVFIVVVFAICYAPNHGETAYFYGKSIDTIMAENMSNVSNGQSLNNIQSAGDYWKWLESVFIGQLYSNSSGWNESTNSHHLLGKSRLRQQRSTQVPCLIKEKYGDIIWKNASYSCHSNPGWQEDTSSYSPGWIPLSPDSWDNDTWNHMSASGLSSVPYWGNMGWYSGGGYDQLLSPHYNEAIKTMSQLRSNNWINEGTRVVLLEFTIYNGDIDLFASVLVAVEFGLTGDICASQSLFVFHPLIFPSFTVTLLIILEAVLAGFTIYFICTIIHSAWKSMSDFFTNLWSYWDMLITCLSSLSVVLFVIIVTNDTDSHQHLVTGSAVDFVDFRQLGVLHYLWIYINAFLLTFVLILVVKQLRYVKFLAAFFLTLRISCCVIFCCAFIFTLILVTYSLVGNLWFGRELSQFLTVGSTFVTLVSLLRGKSTTLAEMAENHLCFSLVFVVTFLYFVLFAVYNLIISEFGKTFHKTRKQINYYNAVKPHDYEIVSFMTKQLKKHFNRDNRSKGAFRNVRFQDCSTISSVVSSQSVISEDVMDEAEELSSSDASQSPAEDGSSSFNSFDASSADAEDITPELAVSSCNQILEKLDRIVRLDELNSVLIDKLQRVMKRCNRSSPGTSQQRTRRTVDGRIHGADTQMNQPPIHLQKAESPLSKKLFAISSEESWV